MVVGELLDDLAVYFVASCAFCKPDLLQVADDEAERARGRRGGKRRRRGKRASPVEAGTAAGGGAQQQEGEELFRCLGGQAPMTAGWT